MVGAASFDYAQETGLAAIISRQGWSSYCEFEGNQKNSPARLVNYP